MFLCPPSSHNRKQYEADSEQVEPQAEKQYEREFFIVILPIDYFHENEGEDEEKTNE
jgi:hypothetical protein